MFKKTVKWVIIILAECVVLLILFLTLNSVFYKPPVFNPSSSDIIVVKSYGDYKDSSTITKTFSDRFSRNKDLPETFKTQALLALSHFPELKDVRIKFIEKEASFPLSSYPEPLSLLIPGVERKYNIVISNKSLKEYEYILLHNLPFEAQIGVLGHELAHTSYYLNKSSLEIAVLGIRYLASESFRKTFEKETDILTINHPLGYQLLDWRTYYEGLLKKKDDDLGSKIYFEDRYLNASEVRKKIRQSPIYKRSDMF